MPLAISTVSLAGMVDAAAGHQAHGPDRFTPDKSALTKDQIGKPIALCFRISAPPTKAIIILFVEC